MTFSLKPELQQFINAKVQAGEYGSVEEVLEAALARLMLDPEESSELDDETIAAIEEGNAQIERGEFVDWTDLAAELRPRYGRS